MKNCPYCQNSTIQKYGKKNNTQRYKFNHCNKTFSFTTKLNSHQIWLDYAERKQTYNQLAIQYHCSVRTIQRHLLKAEKAQLKSPTQQKLNIIADTTFFGRDFGLLVLMDSLFKKVIYHQIVHSEKDVYYKLAINRFREKGYIIQSIICDDRRGLLKGFLDTPTQMCQFHLVAMVMRALRKRRQSEAGKELKILVKTLKTSTKNEFYVRLYFYIKTF